MTRNNNINIILAVNAAPGIKPFFKRTLTALIALIPILLISVIPGGCSKENGSGCFVPAGEYTTQERPGGDIRIIELHDNVNLILTQQDAAGPITVEAGKNLINGISTEINDNRLVIRNGNYCNWTRDFDNPLNVYVPVSKLDTLTYRASGNITCTNTLTNDSLHVDIWEGSGSVKFNVDNQKSRFYLHEGTVDLNVKGQTIVFVLSSHGFGPVDCLDFESRLIYMNTESPNDCYVNALITLEVEIRNIGNVYYTGNPPSINAVINGGGQLINLQ
jgi:hypothetical protein